MQARRVAAGAAIAALCASPAYAKTTTIATLGTAPLLGQIASTSQMKVDVEKNQAVLAQAAEKLGVTPSEYLRFRVAVKNGEARYVTVPRHLDAMSWSGAGGVHVIKDVMIPAGTHGWEVDLREGNSVVALFMPNVCGNLSVLHRTLPRVAVAPSRPRPVAIAPQMAPPVAPIAETEAPAAAPVEVAALPAPTPVPMINVPPVHHVSAGLFAAVLPFLVGALGGGGGGGGAASSGLPCP